MPHYKIHLATIFTICLLVSSCSNELSKEDYDNGYQLILNEKAFEKIKRKRDKALDQKHHFHTSNDYVDGILRIKNKKIEVSARLKGDQLDHLKGNRWSLLMVKKFLQRFGIVWLKKLIH